MKSVFSAFITFFLIIVCSSPVFAAAVVPTVVTASTIPSATTGVAVNTTVSVTFSTGMTSSSITVSSFHIQDSAGNQVATNNPVVSNSNKTFTLTPTANLSYCSTYTLYVETTVKSNSSPTANLATQYSKSFQTVTSATAPTVTSKVPAAAATGVNESSPVTVTFDRMMNPATITATTFGLDNGAAGNITFSSVGNVTTAIFTPSPNLVSTTLYTATVGAGAMSACSVALVSPYSWTFTTRDAAAPFITTVVPTDSAVNIPRTSPISINFSEAMQALTSTNISVSDGVNPIAGTVTFDTVSKLTATFTPTATLDFNTVYTVTVTGAKDLAGNIMAPNPYIFSFTTVAQEIVQYCNIPPYVNNKNLLQKNVLMILDNSNSMDENFNGAAVGSFSPLSKSVAGKTALRNIVQTYSDSMRIGLMTYNLPGASKQYISDSPYFASYEPKSYCANPPADCVDYCTTGSTTSKTVCHDNCVLQNPVFDETYMDESITARTIGDATRTKYCGLVYPKTLSMINPSDPSRFIYYKQSLPMYSGSNPLNWYCYSQTYNPTSELTAVGQSSSSYNCWAVKTNTNDTYLNYTGTNRYNGPFGPTDSDLALGYGNFGRRNVVIPVGQTWFANSSPGGGYLQVAVDSNDTVNTQKNQLLTKLTTYSGNETAYMACTSTSDPNTCSYIVNAGLTPTAGTLQTATDYYTGSTSPIQQPCQQNFIIYVTDGLPSVNSSGTAGAATALIGSDASPAAGTVLSKLDALQSITKTLGTTAYTFKVYTYVLGLGLTSDAKTELDLMAKHGGTNQAYYADNTTQLSAALEGIFGDINAQRSSGTAASILSNSEGSGANILQGVFYPKKYFQDSTEVNWIGEMQNLWYYIDPFSTNSSIREDTDGDLVLNLTNDYVTRFYVNGSDTQVELTQDTNGDGLGDTLIDSAVSPDDVKSLWRAGKQLRSRSANSRTIHTSVAGVSLLTEEVTGKGGFYWGTGTEANATTLISYLQAADKAESEKIISYIRGDDQTNYRPRKVSLIRNDTPTEWKLGDIISSTPRLQTTSQLNTYGESYGDTSYTAFTSSSNYKKRGMVYVGVNDGMLHAFKFGKLAVSGAGISGDVKATLTGTDLGEEQWAYIPRNALPYLKYFTDKDNYKHIYYVDGPSTVSDIAIGKPSACGTGTDYSLCDKDKVNGTNWKTVLIGSMGLGGASSLKGSVACTDGASGTCVKTPTFDPADTSKGLGYSSYFALDVTGQYFNTDGTLANQPTLKWEFAPPGLGYATSGAAIIRVAVKTQSTDINGNTVTTVEKGKNGKWYAVMASGPTGSIDTVEHQFLGKSDQNMKIFIVDLGATAPLVENTNYWVLDTGIKRAFGGSIVPGLIDTDKWNKSLDGNYSDDALYVGYSKANIADSSAITAATKWTDGGVLRILTKEDSSNPANWTVTPVISGIGPVNNGIMKMQDRKSHKLWLYFGTGRFFYSDDDVSSKRHLMGVQEGCYRGDDSINPNCDTSASGPGKPLVCSIGSNGTLTGANCTLVDQSSSVSAINTNKGWYIKLPDQDTPNNMGASRSITDAVAVSSGMVLFTSFSPTSDVCKFGGETRLWSLRYDTGGLPLCASLKGKVMIQMSTGSFEQQNLADIFYCDSGTPTTPGPTRPPKITPPTPPVPPGGGAYPAPPSPPIPGKPPVEPPTYIYPGSNPPLKKVIHIQEK